MKLHHTFFTSIKGLRRNSSRSILTILGIVIGVTAIILISSLGAGAQGLILSQIQGLGSRTIAVHPGRQPKGPSDSAQIFSDSLKMRDLEALQKKSNVPTADMIMPLVYGADTGFYENLSYRLTIFGVTEGIQDVFDMQVSQGNFFNDDDVRAKASVVVIGSKVKSELFGENEAVGQKIKIKNRTFKIIGVLPKKGQVSFINFDEAALVPYTTAQDYLFGIKYLNEIVVTADSNSTINQTLDDVLATLRESHGITDPEKDDFYAQSQADLAKILGTVTDVLTIFLASVAGISLFVAGVGIMNIMLVSVTERTREIGLRKALGATDKDILTQFLLEAVVLTVSGGTIGIILGALFSFLASLLLRYTFELNWTFTFPIGAAIVGFVISALVGLVFGLYPARQAAKKSPIEALRYE